MNIEAHYTEMLMKTLSQNISKVCMLTDRIMWDAYDRSKESYPRSGTGCIEFSRKRDKTLRLSEQEARFAFVESLCQENLRYSVEVPTTKLYKFSGESGNEKSAQTDLQVRECGQYGICNIEFKSKGITPRANCDTKMPIYKDVEKLMREPVWGLWFHLLEGVDRSTIPNFLRVIAEQISKVKAKHADIATPGLTIHICVLRERFSLQKDVPLCLMDADLAEILHVKYRVSKGKLTKDHDFNGWCLTEGIP